MSDQPTSGQLRASATHVLLPETAPDLLDHAEIALESDVEHHLRRVLRLRDGETVSVTDGAGRWRLTTVRSGSQLVLESSSAVVAAASSDRFTIASAIPKGDRVDWLVQKTTELGVDRIVLLHAERSAVRWKAERAAKQIDRLQRIADEAVRQSRRVWRCVVTGPVDVADVAASAAFAEPGGDALHGDESMIAIGPEGGWTERELDAAASRVSMGVSILRTETAAVAATTLRMVVNH